MRLLQTAHSALRIAYAATPPMGAVGVVAFGREQQLRFALLVAIDCVYGLNTRSTSPS